MLIEGKVVVVTGGASGISAALCRRFARESPAGVAVADVDLDGAWADSWAVNDPDRWLGGMRRLVARAGG